MNTEFVLEAPNLRTSNIGTVSTPSSTGELAEDYWRWVPGEKAHTAAPNDRLSLVLVSSIGIGRVGFTGSPNLFCASSGVFLASRVAAPTLAIVALAIRVADAVGDLMTSR